MAALGWALTGAGANLVLEAAEAAAAVAPGAGRELMLIFVGRLVFLWLLLDGWGVAGVF